MPEYNYTLRYVEKDGSSAEEHTSFGYKNKKTGEDVPPVTSLMVYLNDGTAIRAYGESDTKYTYYERELVKPEKVED